MRLRVYAESRNYGPVWITKKARHPDVLGASTNSARYTRFSGASCRYQKQVMFPSKHTQNIMVE